MLEKSVHIVFADSNPGELPSLLIMLFEIAAEEIQRGNIAATAYLDRSLAGIEAQRSKGRVLEVGLCEEVIGDAR